MEIIGIIMSQKEQLESYENEKHEIRQFKSRNEKINHK